MAPAASKAPGEYLLAILMAASPVIGSFWVTPPVTRWIVFAVGVVMLVSVLMVAAKPTRSRESR